MTVAAADLEPRVWDAKETFYFYSGPLSHFAPTPGLKLPPAFYGYKTLGLNDSLVDVPTGEHWLQAIKAQSLSDFDWVMAAPNAASAKRRGGPKGEGGRRLALRPDWEQVKFQAAVFLNKRKFQLEPYRSVLLLTGQVPLVENAPRDFEWGGRDAQGGWTGRNLLGRALMEAREQLWANIGAAVDAFGYSDRRGCPNPLKREGA